MLSAENIVEQGNRYIDASRKLSGDVFSYSNDGKLVDDKKESKFDNYLDAVIWNDIEQMKTNKKVLQQVESLASSTIEIDTPLTKQQARYLAEKERMDVEKDKRDKMKKHPPSIFAGGYCTLYESLKLSKSYELGRLDCLLDMGKGVYKKVEIFTSFYPDYKREIVIALPLYATFEDKTRATFRGIVLNANKTSISVSSWADTRRIQKLLAENALMINSVAYTYVTGYINAKQASKTKTSIHYIDTGDKVIPVQSTTTAPPELKDYIVGAGISILTQLASVFGREYHNSQTPLFEVHPQNVYVEGILSFDSAGIAQQFGQIAEEQEKSVLEHNKQFLQEDKSRIQQYNISPASNQGMIGVGK
jgi:hypothetical protein